MQFAKRMLNREVMQQILDCFVELTGIRAVYFDNYKELVNGKHKDICEFCRLIRAYPALYAGCMQSDEHACRKAEESKSLHLYRCHMGLWEAVIPILVRGFPVGYLMFGQIRSAENEERQWEETAKKLASGEIPSQALHAIEAAYRGVFSLGKEKIEAAAKMLDIIARHIISTEVVSVQDLEAVEKTRKIIHEGFRKSLSTGSIAKQVALSASYLSSLFKKQTGETITGYIEKTRLTHAKHLLDTTSLSVKEISAEVGFEDQNYFSRIFKKQEGMSPMHYRRENRSTSRNIV